MRGLLLTAMVVALSGTAVPAQQPDRGVGSGQVHPDPWLPDLDGTLRRLSEWGGRKLFVFHFASW